MKKVVVTGGAGFISSHLNDALVDRGYDVTAVDVIDEDRCENIRHLFEKDNFHYVKMDITDIESFSRLTNDSDFIYHLAANSDIQNGGQDPSIDYKNTFLTTRSVCEAMRNNGIGNMFFSSTSAVYGDMKGKLNESTGGLRPISYYGAFKLSSEAMISAYSYMNDFNALVFRFPNVVGPRLTHGVIFDFIKKLKDDPKRLQILGNGKQNKQYVYVLDLVKGIIDFSDRIETGYDVYNISTESFTDVDTIADLVCEKMGLNGIKYEYTGGERGWKGDVPTFDYDISKAKEKGWRYSFDSTDSIKQTLKNIELR